MKWQTIDTAPKDESLHVLLWVPRGPKNDMDIPVQASLFEGRFYPDGRQYCIDWEDGITRATHWTTIEPSHRAGLTTP